MTGGAVTFPFEVIKNVMDHFHQLNVHKSMEPDGIHSVVLKELADSSQNFSKVEGVLGDPR